MRDVEARYDEEKRKRQQAEWDLADEQNQRRRIEGNLELAQQRLQETLSRLATMENDRDDWMRRAMELGEELNRLRAAVSLQARDGH
jgi:predicted  nucleic acid-binding Zn-ribbon protein